MSCAAEIALRVLLPDGTEKILTFDSASTAAEIKQNAVFFNSSPIDADEFRLELDNGAVLQDDEQPLAQTPPARVQLVPRARPCRQLPPLLHPPPPPPADPPPPPLSPQPQLPTQLQVQPQLQPQIQPQPQLLSAQHVSREASREVAVLAGGHWEVLESLPRDSVGSLKERLLQRLGASPITRFGLRTPGTVGIQLNDAEQLADHPYIRFWRARSRMPQLLLTDNRAPASKLEKLTTLAIGSLVGRPLVLSHEQHEQTAFRQRMSRLRYELQQRQAGVEHAAHGSLLVLGSGGGDARLAAEIGNAELTLQLALPLQGADVSKTVVARAGEAANSLLERVVVKFLRTKGGGARRGTVLAPASPTELASDYALKVVGQAEFLDGPAPLGSFACIAACVAQKQRVALALVEREPYVAEAAAAAASDSEVLEDVHPSLAHSQASIAARQRTWDQLELLSSWDLARPLRLRLVGVEHVPGAGDDDAPSLLLEAAVYHGGVPLSRVRRVAAPAGVSLAANPRWDLWLCLDELRLPNLPLAARICFTLYARAGSEMRELQPLGWVALQLFDYKHELRQGPLALPLWPQAAANPIGTCVSNSSATSGSVPVLHLLFDQYDRPLVYPSASPPQQYPALRPAPTHATDVLPRDQALQLLDSFARRDPLYAFADRRAHLWAQRRFAPEVPAVLPKLLQCFSYADAAAVAEMHQMLAVWPPLSAEAALELLDSKFADARVRELAVRCLEPLADPTLLLYLLQLVQVLKYEPYHDSALARFLVRRALASKRVGKALFWYLKAEVHVPEIAERYALLLEAYLRGCGGAMRAELKKQDELLKRLTAVALAVRAEPRDDTRRELLQRELRKITLPDKLALPLDLAVECQGLLYDKCRYMDSKKLPLWLTFGNTDPRGQPVLVIFKCGDDLRQDMLTLQMLRIMDRLWKQEGLDLLLSPYGCISTGQDVGLIEVVPNAETLARITKAKGGASAAFREEPLAHWLQSHNPDPHAYAKAVDSFVLSCAGYCVATYVLGIGDRHNDNIMCTRAGRLFHIDFGHFLGHFKEKFGFKRERAPFVFTPDMAYVMGGKDALNFLRFVELCGTAYNVLRRHASTFINLFAMMLSTGIPELTSANDIQYLRDAFSLDSTDQQARDKFTQLIYQSMGTKTTQVMNAIHIALH